MEENQEQNGPDRDICAVPPPLPLPSRENADEHADAAGRSLANALRLSFMLLSVFMIAVLVLFLFTGLTQINPDQCGVKLLFGQIQGEGDERVSGEGLAWSAPEPIGRVARIPTGQHKVNVNDFWVQEAPGDALKPLHQRRISKEGLRPGWDGALLTGDRGLVHVKLTCFYSFPRGRRGAEPGAVMKCLHNITGLDIKEGTNELNMRRADEAVRSAVCGAAIRAAATRTVESIYPTGQKEFADAVAEIAQERLKKLFAGIRIERIEVPTSTVPLAAIAAFNAVTSAATERDKMINAATGEANEMLSATAGGSWTRLLGDSTRPDKPGLLKLYAQAREKGDEAAAPELLEEINNLLTSNRTGGAAARIINEAESYSATVRQRIEARADRFEKLIDNFLATPELMLQRLWAEKKEEILTAPTVVKYYLTPGKKTVLRIGEDPEVRRRRERESLKLKPGRKKDRNR